VEQNTNELLELKKIDELKRVLVLDIDANQLQKEAVNI
jgi:hypothetical protein